MPIFQQSNDSKDTFSLPRFNSELLQEFCIGQY